jgi:hypothetical protein
MEFSFSLVLRRAVGAYSLSLFISEFAIGHRVLSVSSQFSLFVSNLWRALCLTVLVTQITAVLLLESRVTYHGFFYLSFCLSSLRTR